MSNHYQSSVGPHEMTLTFVCKAPRETVWKAWTDPEDFSEWFGGKDMSVPLQTVQMDVQPNGLWKATMEPQQGDPIPFSGKYLDVTPPEKLVMTFDNQQNLSDPNVETLTVTLKDMGDKTEVTLHQVGHLPTEQYPKLVDGYTNFMNAMQELLQDYE